MSLNLETAEMLEREAAQEPVVRTAETVGLLEDPVATLSSPIMAVI